MAEIQIASDFNGGTVSTKEFHSAVFIEDTPGVKKLVVLYKDSSEIAIYNWDGNLFPAPSLVLDTYSLYGALTNINGDNYNKKIVAIPDGKALVQNDEELILVNFSDSLPTKESYNVTLDGLGAGKVSHFDYALERVFFVDNSQNCLHVFSQKIDGTETWVQSINISYFSTSGEGNCLGLRIVKTGFVYALFERNSDHAFIFSISKSGTNSSVLE